MSSTVKSLKVTYNPVNERNTFTCGDAVSGHVMLEVSNDCEINSLLIKFKGKADVMWSEHYGQTTVVYQSKEKYFSFKHFFIREEKDHGDDKLTLLTDKNGAAYSRVVPPGCHVYPFTFQIPFQDLPSSFHESSGKIVYSLEAKLSRSMRIDKKDLVKLNFVPKADLNSVPGLMIPQHESKDKKIKFFASGTVAMDVNIEKMGFFQGERIKVVACIQNKSSREIKPKYCVYKKRSFFAQKKRKVSTKDLLKEVGEPIPPSSNQTVTKVINIPHDCDPSILNCNIMKAEYRLRVYLDIKYASDPEIKFPIVILPASPVPAVEQPLAFGGFGFDAFENPNQSAWSPGPQQPAENQPMDPPPPYGAYRMYPSLTDCNKY
ncbi:hypothetical protein LDENG_00268740 [Lucifuga dentata]|nr:hypothetical protein LDENG_00268740 [Lucifuga dentata]